jgi:hypothetical protein
MMLVLHDDAEREYACGPGKMACRTPRPEPPRRCTTRQAKSWTVTSMKNDWRRVFPGARRDGPQ